jgi:DNA-directed RNA polymerase subunit E'/Rpb7
MMLMGWAIQVQEATGMVLYTIAYKAVVFRPFIGEVLDATVSKVIRV